MIGHLLENRYRITKQLSSSDFHNVFKEVGVDTQEKVAVKIETQHNSEYGAKDLEVLLLLQRTAGVPIHIASGTSRSYRYIITNYLGKSLSARILLQKHTFSIACVLRIAEELLLRIEAIHKHGLIHSNINLENILSGYGRNWQILYLIDFKHCFFFINPLTNSHIPPEENKSRRASIYSSVNCAKKKTLSRRDDLESIAYILIHLLTGTLPWLNLQNSNKSPENIKATIAIEDICKGCPREFLIFLRYCRKLRFEQEPHYEMLRELFKDFARREGIIRNYDWTVSDEKVSRCAKHCRLNTVARSYIVSRCKRGDEKSEVKEYTEKTEKISSITSEVDKNREIKDTVLDKELNFPQFKDKKKILESKHVALEE